MVMSTNSAKPPRPRRKYDNRRRRADAEARQRRIVDAAVALFTEQGFGATSIDQIAATADVSPQSIYATYGSKAGVLSRAIEVALVGDHDGIPVVDRAPGLADMSAAVCVARFAAYAKFIRALNERVAPLIRVMEQAASSDPALGELRSGLRATQQADCRPRGLRDVDDRLALCVFIADHRRGLDARRLRAVAGPRAPAPTAQAAAAERLDGAAVAFRRTSMCSGVDERARPDMRCCFQLAFATSPLYPNSMSS
jgi:AcrR family transcriptional regulator